MNDWMEEFASALDVQPLSPEEVGAVLKLARHVAHGVERKSAPLAAYLLGVAVGTATAPDSSREEAFRLALTAAGPTVPEEAGGVSGEGPAAG
jgi:Domain of unknown function (DUF6457)